LRDLSCSSPKPWRVNIPRRHEKMDRRQKKWEETGNGCVTLPESVSWRGVVPPPESRRRSPAFSFSREGR
jgi:hypothetical protein